MRSLSSAEKKEIEDFVTELNEASAAVDDVEVEYKAKVEELNDKLQSYNNILKNVKDFRVGILQKMEDYKAEREEKKEGWSETDAGNLYAEFVSPWEDQEFEPVALVDETTLDEMGHAAILDELPVSSE